MSSAAYFISDLHLGANYRKANPDREALFHRFLEERAAQGSHLFILGDLFEFWMEYRSFIPKAHFGTLAALGRLAAGGVEVHYLGGNHDFNLGSFFQDQLGIHIHNGPWEVTLQGKKLLLLHGDGLASRDWKFRLMKKITGHPLPNRVFKLLHPDWGMDLARFLSKLSRDRHDNRPHHLDQYEKACRPMLAKGYDALLHGHTHAGFIKEFPEGIYINSGEWLQRLEYVSMTEGRFKLETFAAARHG